MLYALIETFEESGRVARRTNLSGTEQVDLLSALAPSIKGGSASEYVAEGPVLRAAPLSPLLKWPGGKSAELELIKMHMPKVMRRYIEPFLGGGAVFLGVNDGIPAYLNDASEELIDFYLEISLGATTLCDILRRFDDLWKSIEIAVDDNADSTIASYSAFVNSAGSSFAHHVKKTFGPYQEKWQTLLGLAADINTDRLWVEIVASVSSKAARMRKIEAEKGGLSRLDIIGNIEGAVKAAVYYHIRWLYNNMKKMDFDRPLRSSLFFFIREYTYAAMFRYNSSGDFNVPYGGMSYNRKYMAKKLRHLGAPAVTRKFSAAHIERSDFLDYLSRHRPAEGDFIFLDPPYDSDFSDYGKSIFARGDQQRLAQFLLETPAKWMLVIKSTEFILSLYQHKGLYIRAADKKYMWTIKERNIRDTVHLMVTNYQIG
jgi:DNA adenine methylase